MIFVKRFSLVCVAGLLLAVCTACDAPMDTPPPAEQKVAPPSKDDAQPEKKAADKKEDRQGLEEVVNRHVPADFPKARVTKSANHAALRARITPDKASVRRWLLQNRSALVTDVELRPIVLDDDKASEYLATIPFTSKDGEAYSWVVLIDGRTNEYAVVRDWCRRGVDSQAHIVAHGQGGRAALAVQMTYKGRSIVQLWRMQAAGNLVLLGAYGVQTGESAVFQKPNRIVVTRDGGGQETLSMSPKGDAFEVLGAPAPGK